MHAPSVVLPSTRQNLAVTWVVSCLACAGHLMVWRSASSLRSATPASPHTLAPLTSRAPRSIYSKIVPL